MSNGFKLSSQQERLWTLQATHARPLNSVIVAPLANAPDIDSLRKRLEDLVQKNESLRTVYRKTQGLKQPFQVILEQLAPEFIVLPADVTAVDAAEADREHVFDLHNGPVLRLLVCRDGLVLSSPALALDAESLSYMAGHLLHAGQTNAELMQYADYVAWQQELADDPEAKLHESFWRESLKPSSGITIPSLGNSWKQDVATDLVMRLKSFAVESQCSVSDVVISLWSAVLARNEVGGAIGIRSDGRRFDELKGALGAYSRILPLPHLDSASLNVSAAVVAVREKVRQMQSREDFFSWTSVPERISVPFHTVISSNPFESKTLQEPCLCWLSFIDNEAGLAKLSFHFDSSVPASLACRLVEGFEAMAVGAMEERGGRLGSLPVVGEGTKRRLLEEWQGEGRERRKGTIHGWIREQAERNPEGLAVRCMEQVLTYGELEQRSNQMARYLERRGVQPGGLVGLLVGRSVEMLVGVLGILKAGAGYVPLAGEQPVLRLQQQWKRTIALVTEAGYAEKVSAYAGEVVWLDKSEWRGESEAGVEERAGEEHLAYVIHTSGSTGEPKGVGVRHRNLVNYTEAVIARLGLEAGWQYGTVTTLAADLGNTAIYPGLVSGGCVQVVPYEVASDAEGFAVYQDRYGIEVLRIVPSHLTALLNGVGEGGARRVLPKRLLVLGGEALKPELVERIGKSGAGCRVVNHYGPTEATVGALALRLEEWSGAGETVPLGRPLGNMRA